MFFNILSPLLQLLTDLSFKWAERCKLLHCSETGGQDQFNFAWQRPEFTLEQRTADVLLNLTLALVFGSGMPICYLLAAAYFLVAYYVDRWALTRVCHATRYSTAMPKLVMGEGMHQAARPSQGLANKLAVI